MALAEILTDSNNVNAIIEVITLLFIIAGFFRWYDSRYQKSIKETKTEIKETRAEILERIDDAKTSVCAQLTHLEARFSKLEDRFNTHIEAGEN